MKKTIFVFATFGLLGSAFGQSISSFNAADISGVSVLQSGNQITLSVANGATLDYLGNSYNVTDVFGVWALDFGPNPTLNASGSDIGVWDFNSKTNSAGNIFGWKTNPNTGVTPGGSQILNYNSLSGSIDDWGFHIRVDGNLPGGGNTAYFYQEAVPEPASMVLLGGAAMAALARRRKRS